jgi:hypothetical protein
MLAVIAVQLNQLREVHVQPERFFHSLPVELETIGGQLNLVGQPSMQIGNELARAAHRAFADEVGRNQLGIRVHCNENPLVADLRRSILAAYLALLLLNEGPDFIALYIAAVEAAHSRIQKLLASLANGFEKPKDGVSIQASQPFRGANRTAFKKALNRTRCRIGIGNHRGASESFVGIAESGIAGSAAPALNPALTKVTEPLAGLVLASDAGHWLFSACAEREKPYNRFESGVRLTPRSGLAPTPVQAEAGALSYSALSHGGLLTVGLLSGQPLSVSALGGLDLTPKSFAAECIFRLLNSSSLLLAAHLLRVDRM